MKEVEREGLKIRRNQKKSITTNITIFWVYRRMPRIKISRRLIVRKPWKSIPTRAVTKRSSRKLLKPIRFSQTPKSVPPMIDWARTLSSKEPKAEQLQLAILLRCLRRRSGLRKPAQSFIRSNAHSRKSSTARLRESKSRDRELRSAPVQLLKTKKRR